MMERKWQKILPQDLDANKGFKETKLDRNKWGAGELPCA